MLRALFYHPCTNVRVGRPPVLVTSIRVGRLSEPRALPSRVYRPSAVIHARAPSPRITVHYAACSAPSPYHPCTNVLPLRRPTPLRRPPVPMLARAPSSVPYCLSACLAPSCVHAALVHFVSNAHARARSWTRSLLSRPVPVLSHPHCPLLPSLVLSFSPSRSSSSPRHAPRPADLNAPTLISDRP